MIEGWADPELTAREVDALGRTVADAVPGQLPEAGSLSWSAPAFGVGARPQHP